MVSLKTMAAKRFYDYCYPKTKQLGSSFQQVFDEYGCLEAVDIEFNDENKRFTVQAKKQRPLLVDELNKDSSWILEPCTPVLPLGNPENLSHEIYPPIHMQDYYKDTMVHNAQDSSKSRRPVYNIKRHMRNFASDYPDVYQPTYDRLIANESPVVISGKRGRKTMQGKSFNFDPTMLDTPASLLKDLLMEEISEQTKSFVFNEDYTGGVLSMIPISRNPYEHGVLVLPSSSLDGVSLKPFSVVTDSRNVENEGGFTPTIVSGAEHKIPMKGCVLQTDCVYSAENDQQFFAARSQYNVMVGAIETNCVSCKVKNQQLRRIKFSSPEKIQQLSNLSSDRPLCSLSMNPHIHGEAIVATYDQHIYLLNATQHSNPVLDQQEGNSNVEEVYMMTSDGKGWLQVDFAAHPRQIFVANRKTVNVVDLRGSQTSSRLLFTPSDDRLQDEMVLCILSGAKLTNYSANTNEFQCIVATQNYLLLMDQRYCKEPLLEWSLSMRHPCQHLAAAILPTEGATSNFTNHLLLAANQTAQELHCYQYQSKLGVSRQPFSDGDILVPRPPVSVSLPRALGTMKDIRRALSAHPIAKFKRRVVTRLQQPVIGTSALGFLSSDGKVAAVVFQATSCSDLTYQFLTLCDPHLQYEQQNIVTSYSTFETQADGESVSDKTSEIYLNWAKHVTDGFIDEISDKKHESKLTSSKLSLNTHEAYRSLEPHPECLICKGATIFPKKEELASDPEENLPAFQDTELQSGQSIPDGPNHNPKFCRRCQINVKESATVLNFISSGRVKTTHEEDVFNFETTESENSVEDLNLINLDRAKDGVGRILVDTWDGLYSDLWEEMNKEKLLEEEAAKLEQRKNIFDLSAAVDEIPEDQQSDDELTSLFNETVISKTETLPSGHVTPVKLPTTSKPSIMNRKTPRKKMKFDKNSVEDLERSFSKSSLFQRDTSFLFDQNANALAVAPINSSIMNANSPIIHETTSSQNKELVLPNITSTAPKFTASKKNILPSNGNTPVKKGKLKSHRSVGFL